MILLKLIALRYVFIPLVRFVYGIHILLVAVGKDFGSKELMMLRQHRWSSVLIIELTRLRTLVWLALGLTHN